PITSGEADPSRGNAAPQQAEQPFLGVLAQVAERLEAREAGALQSRIVLAAHELHDHREAEAIVHTGDARQRLAHEQRRRLRVLVALTMRERSTDVAAPAAGERLRFVPEVPQDRIVPAASAVGPAHQLE